MVKKKGDQPFITKFDIAVLIALVGVFLCMGVLVKFVFQKEDYVTVELLATGGEWWWGVPPPYYWNFENLSKGAVEYDVLRKPLVQIIDIEKYGHDNRKFTWIKAKLKVTKNIRTGTLSFRQYPLQVGKTINIAPNNIMVIANVVAIEGIGSFFNKHERVITARMVEKRKWAADAVEVGDVMKNSKGEVIAEILDKTDIPSETTTVNWLGEALLKKDPVFHDVILKIKIMVLEAGGQDYFNFYQIIQPGVAVNIQLSKTTIEPFIVSVDN
jgi:hypothetical protein